MAAIFHWAGVPNGIPAFFCALLGKVTKKSKEVLIDFSGFFHGFDIKSEDKSLHVFCSLNAYANTLPHSR